MNHKLIKYVASGMYTKFDQVKYIKKTNKQK